MRIVFSGGTCLSKAYKKIKRFSEDVDFCVQTSKPFSRKEKSNFRKLVIAKINENSNFKVDESNIEITDESSFFSFGIEYEKLFQTPDNLRKNIKVEFKFENLQLESNLCVVESLIHKYIEDDIVKINCVNVTEILANKFSALLWRVYIKDRTKPLSAKYNDPSIMRHLYDITICKNELLSDDFTRLIHLFFEKDKLRAGDNIPNNIKDFANEVLSKLTEDKMYEKEYSQFVTSMCYATEKFPFEQAVNEFKKIIQFI